MFKKWIINKSVYYDILEKQKCLCEGDPELSMTRNCRVHCIHQWNPLGEGIDSQSFNLVEINNDIKVKDARSVSLYPYNRSQILQ